MTQSELTVRQGGTRQWRLNGQLHDPEPLKAAIAAGDHQAVESFAAVWDGTQDPVELMAAVRAA